MRIVVAGVSGYLGRNFAEHFFSSHEVLGLSSKPLLFEFSFPYVLVDFTDYHDIQQYLAPGDVVINCIGRAHKLNKSSLDSYYDQHAANVATVNSLVKASLAASVFRFIHISSVSVYGRENSFPLDERSPCKAESYYAKSKLLGERSVSFYLADSTVDYLILRPPLIYSSNCPGNLLPFVRFLDYLPIIPFGQIHAKKSYLSLENLLSCLATCIHFKSPVKGTFNVTDQDDLSLREFVLIALHALHRSPRRLISFSPLFISSIFTVLGCGPVWSKISDQLVIDSSLITTMLGWIPPNSSSSSLHKAIETSDL